MKTLFAILLALLLLVMAVPTFVSSSWGRNVALNGANLVMKGHLEVKRIDLSWTGGQIIEGFVYKDAAGVTLLSFARFESSASLLKLLLRHFEKTSLDAPYLLLKPYEESSFDLSKTLAQAKKKKKGRRKPFTGEITVAEGTVEFPSPTGALRMEKISCHASCCPLIFTIEGKAIQEGREGLLSAEGDLGEKGQLTIRCDLFPLALLDSWNQTPLFTALFGRTLSLELKWQRNVGSDSFYLVAESPNIKGRIEGTHQGNFLYIAKNTALSFTVTPQPLLLFFPHAKWHLANRPTLDLRIESLRLPLDRGWRDLDAEASLSLNHAQFSQPLFGNFSLDLEAQLKKAQTWDLHYTSKLQGAGGEALLAGSFELDDQLLFTFEGKHLATRLLVSHAKEQNAVEQLLGSHMDLSASGKWDGLIEAEFMLSSPKANFSGAIVGPSLQALTVEGAGGFTLSPALLKLFKQSPDVALHAQLSYDRGSFVLPSLRATLHNPFLEMDLHGHWGEKGRPFETEDVHLTLEGRLLKLPIDEETGRGIGLNEGGFVIDLDGKKNTIKGRAEVSTLFASIGETHTLTAFFSVENFIQEGRIDFTQAVIEGKGELASFPLSLIQPFIAADLNLTALIGPTMDLQMQVHYLPKAMPLMTLTLHGKATEFDIDMELALDETLSVCGKMPATVHWEMTPIRYLALMDYFQPEKKPEFILKEPVRMDLAMEQLTCPTESPSTRSQFLCQCGFVGEFTFGPMVFVNRETHHELKLLDLGMQVDGVNFSEAINLRAHGRMELADSQSGGFLFSGKMLHFWTPEGKFNKQNLTLLGDLSLERIPVKELTGILPLDTETVTRVRALLGPLLNARLSGEISHLTGPLTLDIQSSNFKAVLPFQLANGAMTLRDRIQAEVTLTEDINEIFLKDVMPLIISGAWSDHPIRLTIDPQNFLIPFHQYSFDKVQIGSATIDLGKLRVKNQGNIFSLLKFLQVKEISDEGVMEVWFTPIYFSLGQGEATYQRFDALLAKSVHIALWGRVNLIEDKVRMTLAISPRTLYERYQIRGLPGMFQVKMRGSTSHVELDWGSATTRIGLIVARSTGGFGNLVGGLVEQILQAMGEEKTPPPTTVPFPWEAEYSENF